MTHTTKHTPGPWVINANGDITSPHGAICWLPSGIANKQKNAHLIAAAPAMYEALREAHELIRSLVAEEMIHGTELQHVGNCQANMWSALAQAEGK